MRSRVQAAKIGFLRRNSGLILLEKVKSAGIREFLNIESLLLRLQRLQLRWYGHMTRMSQEKTAKKLRCLTPIGRKPRDRPRTRWQDYTLKILLVTRWHPTRASILYCRGLRCLEAPTRAATPATPQG